MEDKVFNEDIDFDIDNDVQEPTGSEDKDAEIAKLRAIAQRRKEQLEELKAKADKEPELDKQPKEAPSSDMEKRFERLELKAEGYKEDEIDFLMEYGGRKAINHPIIKQSIAAMREQHQAELATQGEGSSKSGSHKGVSPEDLKKMPVEELIKLAKQEAK